MKRCLVIDDSKVIRRVISRAVVELGFEVQEAEDGRRGLDSQGYVVTVQSRFEGVREAGQLATSPADPLVSQFTPSYGMVLNLLQRYDLAKVGRYKVNKKLGLDLPLTQSVLTLEDIVQTIEYLVRLHAGHDEHAPGPQGGDQRRRRLHEHGSREIGGDHVRRRKRRR